MDMQMDISLRSSFGSFLQEDYYARLFLALVIVPPHIQWMC